MKYNYDYAAEMVKIADSAEHKKLFGMEKLAFSRDDVSDGPSEVEEEMKRLAKACSCDGDCDCRADEDEEKEEKDEEEGEKKEASDTSLEDTASILLEISNELEEQGMDRLAAASLVLADNILKTAADRKSTSDKSKTDKSKTDKSKTDKSKSSGKKLTMKERMEKMRAMQGKKKGKKEDKSKK